MTESIVMLLSWFVLGFGVACIFGRVVRVADCGVRLADRQNVRQQMPGRFPATAGPLA